MCAIAGVLGLPCLPETAERMLGTMARRGPDGNGIHRDGDCTLLHARLAVIDPQGGRQPMELEWEGERYVLIYNGELYNTQELRRELQNLGHEFRGHSDTEVLLHAFARWGEACLEKLNGIFAFAVWETRCRRLFLARDRIGVKPLFFKCHDGGLLFASELKTVLEYPTVEAELDAQGAAELLLLGPGRTFEEWERQSELVRSKLNITFNEKHARFWRAYMHNSAIVEPDAKLGRLSIPKKLLELIGVTKEVTFSGNDHKIEIWAKENFESGIISSEEFTSIANMLSDL